MRLAHEGKTFSTCLSRCDLTIEHAEYLSEFERKGVPTVSPPPSFILKEFCTLRTDIIVSEATNVADKAFEKSSLASTAKAKERALAAGILKLREITQGLKKRSVVSHLENKLRQEIHRVTLEGYLEAARKAEFKGNVKKAIDQYQEALFFMRNDDINDTQQQSSIRQIEAKLEDLSVNSFVQSKAVARKVSPLEGTLSADLAKKVDDLVRVFGETPVMAEKERTRLADKFTRAAITKVLDEGITYGQASGAPSFLNQDEDSFRTFIKEVDQNLDWQCDTVAAAFDRFWETGEVPAPHYPMRIAVLLRKAKDFDRERQFLAAWCKHFPSGNGRTFGKLLERAKKVGAIE